jgi:hypothetical protein
MFGPSALNTDQVQEDRGGVGESSIRSDETGVAGTLGAINQCSESFASDCGSDGSAPCFEVH